MAQETYDAELAGLHWNLSLTSKGIKINMDGYSDRLSDLALTIMSEFLLPSTGTNHEKDAHTTTTSSSSSSSTALPRFLQESYFHSVKDRVLRGLKSYYTTRRAD